MDAKFYQMFLSIYGDDKDFPCGINMANYINILPNIKLCLHSS